MLEMESALDHPDRRPARTCFLLHFFFYFFLLLRFMARDTLRTWPSTSILFSTKFDGEIFLCLIFGLNFSISLFHHIVSRLRSHLAAILLSVMLTACKYEQNSIWGS